MVILKYKRLKFKLKRKLSRFYFFKWSKDMNSFLFICLFGKKFVTIEQNYKGHGFFSAMNKVFFQHPCYFMYL
jgi:hypothetical protein